MTCSPRQQELVVERNIVSTFLALVEDNLGYSVVSSQGSALIVLTKFRIWTLWVLHGTAGSVAQIGLVQRPISHLHKRAFRERGTREALGRAFHVAAGERR